MKKPVLTYEPLGDSAVTVTIGPARDATALLRARALAAALLKTLRRACWMWRRLTRRSPFITSSVEAPTSRSTSFGRMTRICARNDPARRLSWREASISPAVPAITTHGISIDPCGPTQAIKNFPTPSAK